MSKLTLSIDTAVLDGSFSLWESDKMLAEVVCGDGKKLSAEILTTISNLFDKSERRISDTDRIICTVGPGSYTGVRVGIATSLGLRKSLKCEIVPVTVFEAFSMNASQHTNLIAFSYIGKDEVAFQEFRLEREFSGSTVKSQHPQKLFEHQKQYPDTVFVSDRKNIERYLDEFPNTEDRANLITARENISLDSFRFCSTTGRQFSKSDILPEYGKEFGVAK